MAEQRTSRQQIGDLHKVLEITRAMAASEDLDALLSLIVERDMELLDAERATVFLYDDDADELVSRIAHGEKEIRIPAAAGIAGAAAAGGEAVSVPDAYADARFNPDVDRRTGFRTRNILAIPMRGYDSRLVGVLQVLNKRRGEFDTGDLDLAETMAAQAGVAIQRANLIEHYLEKQQMERAMAIARQIQQALLPQEAPAIDGYDVAGFSRPADETGGDTYDFLELPDGRWMFTVADATGHGVGPALVIAETRAMLRAICVQSDGSADVGDVLGTTNNLLQWDLTDGRFVTCFLGLLDPRRDELVYGSAGHGPLLFYARDADEFQKVPATGIPLGVLEGMDFSITETRYLAAGDLAVIITDGFFEAANPDGEEFGIPRIVELLRDARDLTAAEMIQRLVTAVTNFTASQPQADDLTAVVVKKT